VQPTSKLDTKSVGQIGEDLAAYYLESLEHTVLAHNYFKKYGEIDIISSKDEIVHFNEVKTVSYETRDALEAAVSHETWRPEEMVHKHKLHQIKKAVQAWLSEHSFMGNMQINVIAIRVVPRETYYTVNFIENVIIDE
jgi:Holliday junction resolvase-like predicted endonuclease